MALNQFVGGPNSQKPASCLTPREQQVLTEIASGYSNKRLASASAWACAQSKPIANGLCASSIFTAWRA